MHITFRLVLAAALVTLSGAAHAEKITVMCERAPENTDGWAPFHFDIDYDRRIIIWGGKTSPAQITDKEITWESKKEGSVDSYRLDRITGRFTAAWSIMGRVGASFYQCSRAKQRL